MVFQMKSIREQNKIDWFVSQTKLKLKNSCFIFDDGFVALVRKCGSLLGSVQTWCPSTVLAGRALMYVNTPVSQVPAPEFVHNVGALL